MGGGAILVSVRYKLFWFQVANSLWIHLNKISVQLEPAIGQLGLLDTIRGESRHRVILGQTVDFTRQTALDQSQNALQSSYYGSLATLEGGWSSKDRQDQSDNEASLHHNGGTQSRRGGCRICQWCTLIWVLKKDSVQGDKITEKTTCCVLTSLFFNNSIVCGMWAFSKRGHL